MLYQICVWLLYTYIVTGLLGLAAFIFNAIYVRLFNHSSAVKRSRWGITQGRGDWWWYNG